MHGTSLLRRLRAQPQKAGRFGHLGEIRVVQVGAEVQDAGRLHLQLDEGQRVVPEDHDLDGQLELPEGEQFAHEHGETAVSAHGDDLSAGMADLRSDGLGQGIGHRSMVEGAEERPAAVHREVAGRPDGRRGGRLWATANEPRGAVFQFTLPADGKGTNASEA